MRLMTAIAGAFLTALSLAPATATAAPENPDMQPMIIGGSYAQNFPTRRACSSTDGRTARPRRSHLSGS